MTERHVKAIGVLVDVTTNIIQAVAPYNFDLSSTLESQAYRTVLWWRSNPYDPKTLVGKRWLEDGTVEDVPILHTWESVRTRRDTALTSTDWTQVGDTPLSSEKVQEFAVWRQQLRDLPQQYATPDEAMVALEVLLNNKP